MRGKGTCANPSRPPRPSPPPQPTIPIRVGKIALLPDAVREQLNLRLAEGEGGQPLLDWLNSLPQTKKIVERHYEGQPVNKQNLSDWRHGGYAEWRLRDDLHEQALELSEQAHDLEEEHGKLLADKLTTVFTARYAALLLRWDGQASPQFDSRLRLYSRMRRDILRLQQSAHETARLRRQWKDLETEDADEYHRKAQEICKLPEDHPVYQQFLRVRSNGDPQMLNHFLDNARYENPIGHTLRCLPEDIREEIQAEQAKAARKAKRQAAAAQRKAERKASTPQCDPTSPAAGGASVPASLPNSEPGTQNPELTPAPVKPSQEPAESPQPSVHQPSTINPQPLPSTQVKPLLDNPNPPPQNPETMN